MIGYERMGRKKSAFFMVQFVGKNSVRLIGVGILIFFYVRWDFTRILGAIKNADLLFFAGSIVAVNLVVLLQAWRGYVLLGQERFKLDFRTYARFYFVTMASSMATPGRVGAVTQVPLLHQRGIGVGDGFANVIYDKLCDLTGFFAMGALFGMLMTDISLVDPLLLVSLCCITLLTMWHLDFLFTITSKPIERIFPKVTGKWSKDKISLESDIKGYALVLTMFRLFGAVVVHWFVSQAAGMNVSLTSLSAAAAFGALSTLLPVSVMGIGLREGIFLLLFSGKGYPEEQILTFAFLVLLAYLSTVPVGIFLAVSSDRIKQEKVNISTVVKEKP